MRNSNKKSRKKFTVAMLCLVVVGLFVAYSCDKSTEPISKDVENPTYENKDSLRTDSDTLYAKDSCNMTKDIFVSKCKRESALKNNEDAEDTTQTQVIYQGKWLYISHQNIYINCVATGVNVTTLVKGDTIEVNMSQILGDIAVTCECPVDVSYSVGEFEKGTYLLIIKLHGKQIYSQIVNF